MSSNQSFECSMLGTVVEDEFLEDVRHGFGEFPKTLPVKYLYDERGSELFERICETSDYYPTRTERSILERWGDEMAEVIGERCVLIEPGAGNCQKARYLLDHLVRPACFVPIDISGEFLAKAAADLAKDYENVEILPFEGDFLRKFELPEHVPSGARRVAYFPGSTIGNFDPPVALSLLKNMAEMCGPGGGVLIGVDLKKNPDVLEAAYDDSDGMTKEFTLNLLDRINRELDGDFDRDAFWFHASYQPRDGRVELYLISKWEQTVHVAGEEYRFDAGECIHTENSHKFSLRTFRRVADQAGMDVERVWMDERRYFSVQFLRVRDPRAELS